ncbi:MAG TPA: FeoA family protein [Planctomycetota bacterium]|nr:FeoA family protein [Planctomycetota bacterium]
MRLSHFLPGQSGKIIQVKSDGSVGQRLMEMGLFEGADVKVVRIAPLGDPMEVEVQGYRLSLRKVEAERVEVEP